MIATKSKLDAMSVSRCQLCYFSASVFHLFRAAPILIMALASLLLFDVKLFGQEKDADGSWIFTKTNPRQFTGPGINACQKCHEQEAKPELWALVNEKLTWTHFDRHSDAYKSLVSDRSKEIGRRLGQPEIHRDKRCLACHVGMPTHQMAPENKLLVAVEMITEKNDGVPTPVTAGVSCESCHGPSETSKAGDEFGWITVHQAGDRPFPGLATPWRFTTAKEKLEQFGYYDVRAPIARTKMCVSCHVGNVEQGKVVTHDMYSAGHPPLPGFETVMFTDQQPRHWRKFLEKPDNVRKTFVEKTNTKAPSPSHLHETRDLLVSALTAASESLRLTANLANTESKLPASLPKPRWPELAQFACYDCHHDLKTPSWRQERGFKLMPGRPSLHEWPSVLAEVALDVAGEGESLASKMKPLVDELNQHPFGQGSEFSKQASQVAVWLDAVARKLNEAEFTREFAHKTMEALSRRAGQREVDYLNYNSARQLIWAFDVVYRDLHQQRSSIAKPIGWYRDASGKRIDKLDTVQQSLAAFDEFILLDLPNKNDKKKAPIGEAALIANYEPEKFQQRFAALFELYLKARDKAESPQKSTGAKTTTESIRR